MIRRAFYTAEEFEHVAESMGSTELIRGEVVQLSPAGLQQSRTVTCVALLLQQWARRSRRGRVLLGEVGLIVETHPDTVRGADVVYVSYKRIPRNREPRGFLRTPPELIVEVLSEDQGWSEMRDKVLQYLAFGVDRVWVIHPELQQVRVYRADAEPATVEGEEPLTDEDLLPGFSCAVREFFED